MDTSLLPLIYGEHIQLVARTGIQPCSFIELRTAERHALVCSLVARRVSDTNLVSQEDLQTYLAGIDQAIISAAGKIKSPSLWSARVYRDLVRLLRCSHALKSLRHTEEITESRVKVLHALPAEWRRPSIVQLLNSRDQARAVVSLGQTVELLFGEKRQHEFRDLVERLQDTGQIREKFYTFVLRSLNAASLPSSEAPFLKRIVSYSDCKRLAQIGHCFGDLDMIESVLEAGSYFYAWSRRPGVVVEIERDEFPFSWTIVQAFKPKSRALTSSETEALIADIRGLGAPVTTKKLSRLVSASLEQFD